METPSPNSDSTIAATCTAVIDRKAMTGRSHLGPAVAAVAEGLTAGRVLAAGALLGGTAVAVRPPCRWPATTVTLSRH